MSLGTLGAISLGNILTGKGIIKAGRGIIRAGYGSKGSSIILELIGLLCMHWIIMLLILAVLV